MLLLDYYKLSRADRIAAAHAEALVTGLPSKQIYEWLEQACSHYSIQVEAVRTKRMEASA